MTDLFRRSRVIALVAIFTCATTGAAQPTLEITSYRGQVVIVDFWASWCKPCRASIPWLNQMRARYGTQGLAIIGVNVDADRADAERFLREIPANFEILYDSQGVLAGKFGVQAMPSSFVYDRNGRLVRTHHGFRENQRGEHESELAALLADKGS